MAREFPSVVRLVTSCYTPFTLLLMYYRVILRRRQLTCTRVHVWKCASPAGLRASFRCLAGRSELRSCRRSDVSASLPRQYGMMLAGHGARWWPPIQHWSTSVQAEHCYQQRHRQRDISVRICSC